MDNNELQDFVKLFSVVASYYGKDKTKESAMIYWNALKAYPFETVKTILNLHIQTSRFMPMVADILDELKRIDGRPEPQEAWATVARSLTNEGVTVVWTEEMAKAFGVALGVQADKVAARMAFLEHYKAEVDKARRGGVQVKWTASLGHDQSGREGPLLEALKAGKLVRDHVAGLLPYNDVPNADVVKLLLVKHV